MREPRVASSSSIALLYLSSLLCFWFAILMKFPVSVVLNFYFQVRNFAPLSVPSFKFGSLQQNQI